MKPIVKYLREILETYWSKRGPLLARGISYSLLIGSLPIIFITIAVSSAIYNLLPSMQEAVHARIEVFMPSSIGNLLIARIEGVARDWAGLGLIGLAIMLYTARGMFDDLESGLSWVMDMTRRRSTIRHQLFTLLLTLLSVVLFVEAALGDLLLTETLRALHVPSLLSEVAFKGVSVVVLGAILYGLYRLVYRQTLNKPVALGVCFSLSLLWKLFGYAGKALIVQSGQREMMYGVLAGAVLLLFWLQIFSNLIIFGGIVIARHSGKKA